MRDGGLDMNNRRRAVAGHRNPRILVLGFVLFFLGNMCDIVFTRVFYVRINDSAHRGSLSIWSLLAARWGKTVARQIHVVGIGGSTIESEVPVRQWLTCPS